MTTNPINPSDQNNSTVKAAAATALGSAVSGFTFSQKSLKLLNTVDKRLDILANEVLKISKIRFEITEGHRDLETQQKYFRDGKSKCDGIIKRSRHQDKKAIDIVCYIPFKRMDRKEQDSIKEIFGKTENPVTKGGRTITEDRGGGEVASGKRADKAARECKILGQIAITKKLNELSAENKVTNEAIPIKKIDETKSYITWEHKYYYYIAGLFEAKAREMRDRTDLNQNLRQDLSQNLDIDIRWGGWFSNRDGSSFEDCVHFEIRD